VRNAQLDDVTSDGLHCLSLLVKDYLTGKCEEFKTAVIAPDDLSFGIARIYEAISFNSPESVMVFREKNEALKWIGVDGSTLE